MRILDRYLLRELLVPLGYCLGGFLIFWISFDLFSELGRFQEAHLRPAEVARYYAFRMPEFLVLVLPVALLLALLYTLTHLARQNELTAIRAAGTSLMRLSLPYLCVGFAWSAGLFALNELWAPKASLAAEELLAGKSRPGEEEGRWEHNLSFRNARDGRIWTIGSYNTETGEMRNPQIEWQLPDGGRHTLLATNGVREGSIWVFRGVTEMKHPAGARAKAETNDSRIALTTTATNLSVLAMPELAETPRQIKSEIKIGRLSSVKAAKEAQLSLREIIDYLELHPDLSPRDGALLHTQMHGRIAGPWTSLVVVLIAIPFGALSGRRNVFVGVAASIFICFAYFILLRLGLALGTGGYVAPWVGAWAPNVLFAAAGLWLARRFR